MFVMKFYISVSTSSFVAAYTIHGVLRHQRRSDDPAAVCSECGSTFGARRYDRITPVLDELHWLPVRRRVDFKMTCTLVYLSLSGMAPALYLAADCQLVSDEGRRQLRSANSRTCRQTDLRQLCRQMYCCLRSKTVEQPSSSSQTN